MHDLPNEVSKLKRRCIGCEIIVFVLILVVGYHWYSLKELEEKHNRLVQAHLSLVDTFNSNVDKHNRDRWRR